MDPPADGATSPSSRRRQRAVAALLALFVAASLAGNALTPAILRASPVALLIVVSSYAQMGLAAPALDPATFIAIAALRRWVGEVVAFWAGRELGAPALRWLGRERRHPSTLLSRLDTTWAPLRDALVVLVPHPLLSALFGMSGMSPRRFTVLKLAGSLLSVTALWWLAALATVPLTSAAAFVERNAAALTFALLAGGGVWLLWRRRSPERSLRPED